MLTQIYNGEYSYRLYLCSANKTILCELDYKDIKYSAYLTEIDELQFTIDYFQNGFVQIKDERYDLLHGLYFILMDIVEGDVVIKQKYFVVSEPIDSFSNNQTQKRVRCFASEYVTFGRKKLRAYKQNSQLIYDSVGTNGILNYITHTILLDTWSVYYCSSAFNGVYHTFDFTDNTILDVFKKLEHDFNCVLQFDNINNRISVYSKTEIGDNTGLVLSGDNFLNDISYSPKFDQIVTRLYVIGKNNATISQYNITGQQYIDNFDWFVDNGYFSADLQEKWEAYSTKASGYVGTFNTLITNLNTYESELLVLQSELATLITQKKIIEDSMDAVKRTQYKNNVTYDELYVDLQDVNTNITNKNSAITAKQAQITSTQSSIATVVNELAYTNPANFSSANLQELINFIYEDTLQIETVGDGNLLYQYGLDYVEIKSQPIYDISIDIVDILSTTDAHMVRQKFNIGDYIYVDAPTIGFDNLELQLVSYTHDKTNTRLSLQFSNTLKIENSLFNLNDIFKKANQAAIDLNQKKDDYNAFQIDKDDLLYVDSTINTENTEILAGTNYINRRGFIGNELGGYGQIQIMDDRIIFSKDAWQTFFTLLSAGGLYLENSYANSRVVITPENGFQIDQWNEALLDWFNVVYIGTSGQVHIDNGYIQMEKITESVLERDEFGNPTQTVMIPKNRIIIAPEDGLRIQQNEYSINEFLEITNNWVDVFYADQEGNLVWKNFYSNLFAENANVAAITNDRLDSSSKVAKYTASDFGDFGYIDIKDNEIKVISATYYFGSSDVLNRDGDKLYWTDDAKKYVTTRVTSYPVRKYNYDETTVLSLKAESGALLMTQPYTTAGVPRNIHISTTTPDSGLGADGDVCLVVSA